MGEKRVFSESDLGPFAILKQGFLALFEPVVTRFGPWKRPKCLEKGPFWDQNIYIYPLIYTPLPNCRWFHHTALRYVQRVQLVAYTWRKVLNSIKMGSKCANFICLRTPKGPGSLLEKHVFDPFFTHFWSQKRPLFKGHWDFPWAKTRNQGLKNRPKTLV